jgi:23S rRNA (uracil1939-C5)-methyltransferase
MFEGQVESKEKSMENFRIQKNEEYEMDIVDIGTDGAGIGRIFGYALFVKDTVPGDTVLVKVIKVKKNFGYGRLVKILKPSPDRVEAKCPVAKQCGGCQLQHVSYERQLEYKQNKVKNCLERIGGVQDVCLEPIVGMEEPYHYRNKAQFPVGRTKDGKLAIGFYAGRTHSIINTESCMIQAEINEKIMNLVRAFLERYHISVYEEETHTGLVRHILTRAGFATGELMVCLVVNGEKLPHEEEFVEMLTGADFGSVGKREENGSFEYEKERHAKEKNSFWKMTSISLNINKEKTNVILGQTCRFLWGREYITDKIGENVYRISPLSFYQVNPVQTKKLYDLVLEFAGLTGKETVWDLYCGTGTISLFLARRAKKVYGVEIVPQAIEDAKENAKANGIENAEFFCGAAEEVVPAWHEREPEAGADVIVVDPPRKGCDEKLLNTIVEMEPEKIVYVSCDPATLARDVKILGGMGYRMERGRVCDMFGNSVHCETVILLSKQKTDSQISF